MYIIIRNKMPSCPYCGEERDNNPCGKYHCQYCQTYYWQELGKPPTKMRCPHCREGVVPINADGLYKCKECSTKWRQEIGEDGPCYGHVDCSSDWCENQLEFFPGTSSYECGSCGCGMLKSTPDSV